MKNIQMLKNLSIHQYRVIKAAKKSKSKEPTRGKGGEEGEREEERKHATANQTRQIKIPLQCACGVLLRTSDKREILCCRLSKPIAIFLHSPTAADDAAI